MRKIFLVIFFVYISFLIEFLLFNLAQKWFLPNILLLVTMFFTLLYGIRFGLLAAILAGILKDSFTIGFFGISLFSLVACAYMTIILKRYIYRSSMQSIPLLVFFIAILNVVLHYCLYFMNSIVHVVDVLKFILIPEVLATVVISSYTFTFLRKCVLKFSV